MDPEPDPGGPKTCGSGGSGFGSGFATPLYTLIQCVRERGGMGFWSSDR
jgi:hypothetical protein